MQLRVALPAAVLAAGVLAACGSSSSGSSGNAGALLKQTFSGAHTVNSGNLSISLSLDPVGSSTLTTPITLSFGGPFQNLGTGKLPKSNFTIAISALGHTGQLGIISTGTAGYVTMQGTAYQLPAATFQKLESSFASLAASPTGGSGSGALAKLGIHPLSWLKNPSVIGTESVGGTDTTHIRAGVNVAALLSGLNTLLGKASSLGVSSSIPSSISQATQQKIAGEVHSASFDVWTGIGDKTVRKMMVGLTLPVHGSLSTLLGGINSAAITLTMQYARPQPAADDRRTDEAGALQPIHREAAVDRRRDLERGRDLAPRLERLRQRIDGFLAPRLERLRQRIDGLQRVHRVHGLDRLELGRRCYAVRPVHPRRRLRRDEDAEVRIVGRQVADRYSRPTSWSSSSSSSSMSSSSSVIEPGW